MQEKSVQRHAKRHHSQRQSFKPHTNCEDTNTSQKKSNNPEKGDFFIKRKLISN
jgi:hypothetical protein